MSPSDVALRASSTLADPADALREALFDLVAAGAQAGVTPADFTQIEIAAPAPEAYHPRRRDIDLAWRDVLGGLRKPVCFVRAGAHLVVSAQAVTPAAREWPPLWRGMNLPELARQYSPRQQADMRAVFARWRADGAAARARCAGRDIAYGPARDETFDFYPAARRDAPLWVFLHGGYWQACSKEQHGQFGEGLTAQGYAVAVLDYGLAPETPLVDIVPQIRRALTFLVGEADALGFDASRVHLAGHSAGAQLAALAAVDPQGPRIASALLISGVFDLAPLFHLPMGRLLGLAEAAQARALSPLFAPRPAARVGLALGALESAEFARQSDEMAAAWGAETPLRAAERHHFDVLEDLRSDSPLLRLALRTAA